MARLRNTDLMTLFFFCAGVQGARWKLESIIPLSKTSSFLKIEVFHFFGPSWQFSLFRTLKPPPVGAALHPALTNLGGVLTTHTNQSPQYLKISVFRSK